MSAEETKITLHWGNLSRATRTLWLLEELGVDYNVEVYFRGPDFRLPKTLTKYSELGKSPIVEVETKGRHKVLIESGHIQNYLIKRHDPNGVFTCTNEDDEDDVDFYTQYAESTLMLPIMMYLILQLAEKQCPWFIKPVVTAFTSSLKSLYLVPETHKVVTKLENDLKRKGKTAEGELYFVGGKLSGADTMLVWAFEGALLVIEGLKNEFDATRYPYLMQWLSQMKQRPAYLRIKEKEKGFMERKADSKL